MPQPADQVPQDPGYSPVGSSPPGANGVPPSVGRGKCLPVGHARRDRRRALVFAFLTAVLWGTAYVAAKYALRTLGPFTAAAGRFVLGSALLWPLLLALRPARAGVARITPGRGTGSRPQPAGGDRAQRVERGDLPLIVAIGLFQVTFYFALQYVGMRYTTAANTALIVNIRPVFVALLSAVWLHEALGRDRLVGILVAFLGVAILSLGQGGSSFGFSARRALGDLLILLNAISGAIAIILLKRMLGRFAPLLAAAYTTTVGAVGLLILAVIEMAQGGGSSGLSAGSLLSWGAVAFMAIFNTVIPFLLWYSALAQLSTTETTVFLYLTPLISVLLSAALLGEPVGAGLLIGGALILAGAYRTVSAGRARPETLEN